MNDVKKKFGKRIKEIRISKNLNQKTLADRMEVDRTYISKIENGKKNPTLEVIHRLSRELETSLETIFQFE